MLPAEVGGGAGGRPARHPPEKGPWKLEDPQKYAAGLRLAPDLGLGYRTSPTSGRWRATRPAAGPLRAHAQLAAIAKPELTYGGPRPT